MQIKGLASERLSKLVLHFVDSKKLSGLQDAAWCPPLSGFPKKVKKKKCFQLNDNVLWIVRHVLLSEMFKICL